MTTVYIAAKAPRPGLAKTRLGLAIGHDRAVMLYKAFLQDVAARFTDAPFEVAWYVTPSDAWDELGPLIGWTGQPIRVLAQGAGDWTERQEALLRGAAERGETTFMVMASDSPHLSVATVAAAAAALEAYDVVVGPTHDGGYYLLGMRGWHDVLSGVTMSTHSALDDILARAAAARLSVAVLEETFDVDGPDDLPLLRRRAAEQDDLAYTRAALVALGLDEDGSVDAAAADRAAS